MTTSEGEDALHVQLLDLVFAKGQTPQRACLTAFPQHPERKALDVVFVITLIATDLKSSFRPDDHWSYADWLEAATALSCDVYASSRLGTPDPTLAQVIRLWPQAQSQTRSQTRSQTCETAPKD